MGDPPGALGPLDAVDRSIAGHGLESHHRRERSRNDISGARERVNRARSGRESRDRERDANDRDTSRVHRPHSERDVQSRSRRSERPRSEKDVAEKVEHGSHERRHGVREHGVREKEKRHYHEHRSRDRAADGSRKEGSRRKRPRHGTPDLEDGQLPSAPQDNAIAGDQVAQGPPRSPQSREAKRERRRERKRREREGKGKLEQRPADLMAGLTADEIQQMQQLGLPFGFSTTQGLEVDDAAAKESAVKVTSQRKARQFMNRKGGFNRMLPAEQTGKKMQEV